MIQQQTAGIYHKNTDLDTSNYDAKKAEDELLIAYYKNYMNDDKLTDEEKLLYKQKADKLIEEQETRLARDYSDEGLDPTKIKDMLD